MKASARFVSIVSCFGFGRSRAGRATAPYFFAGSKGSGAGPRLRGRFLLAVTASFAVLLIFAASSALAATPELKIDPTVTAGYTTVEFSGEVDPKGDTIEWYDEVSTDGGANWEFGDVLGFSEEGTPQLITNAVHGGLAPGTTYKIRITAYDITTDELLASAEPSPEFTTKSVNAPSATLDPITTTTDTTAVLKATIDPNSPGGLDEEGKNLFATAYEFHCSPECPGLAGGTVPAEATGTELEVEVLATGLEPNKQYTVTVSATNRGGEATDGPQTFTTDATSPSIGTGPGASKTQGTYTVEGTVNPHNTSIATCVFEWGPTAAYGHVAPCEPMPGGGNDPVFVTATLSGLDIGAEYHFRLVASNGIGLPVATPDATFLAHKPCGNEEIREAQGSTFLPECRAWELASNPYKEGFAAILKSVSPDGARLEYASNGNFEENGFGSSGVLTGNPYLSTRGTGWSTEALAPKGPLFNSPYAVPTTAFSPDFTSSIWRSRLADQVVGEEGFFRRGPDGSFDLIGPAFDFSKLPPSAPGGPSVSEPSQRPLAASADMSRFAFAPAGPAWSDPGLQPSAPRLYEYRGASAPRPTLASVDSDRQPINPGCATYVGTGEGDNGKSESRMSEDGRVLFWSSVCAPGSSQGEIFARFENGTVVAVSASQCDRGPTEPCLDEPVLAEYHGAASDGSIVYFTTTGQLVDGDHDTSGDLYACAIPPGEPVAVGPLNSCESLTEISGAATGNEVQGVICVSADGNRVYYVAHGVLASNPGPNGEAAVSGQNNLYMWERADSLPLGGTTTFIGDLDSEDATLWSTSLNVQQSAQTTASGGFLLLTVHAALVDSGPQADTDGGALDVYRYDAETATMLRLSTATSGQGGNRPGANATIAPVGLFPLGPVATHPAISEEGSVVFLTEERLSPLDHNASPDSYLWRQGKLTLLSSGSARSLDPSGNTTGKAPMISSKGEDAFFATATPLTTNDADTTYDVYDARVKGGFAFPGSEEPCVGEGGCRVLAPPSPGPATAATRSSGQGNPPKPKTCPKGKVKRKGRCVKLPPKHRRHRKHHPHAHHKKDQHHRNAHK